MGQKTAERRIEYSARKEMHRARRGVSGVGEMSLGEEEDRRAS